MAGGHVYLDFLTVGRILINGIPFDPHNFTVAIKTPCIVAAQSDVDLASPPAAIDGVTLAADNRVLMLVQTSGAGGADNGPWLFNGAGVPMTRPEDFDEDLDVTSGLFIAIDQGTDADKNYQLTTNDPITLGVTVLTFRLTGDVVGPTVSVANNIAIFSNTTGDSISDSGVAISDVTKVRVTSNDSTPDHLKAKLTTATTAVTFTEINDGADEDLRIDVADMVGDSGAGGVAGLVPAPAAGDAAAGKILKADGTWVTAPGMGDVIGPSGAVDSNLAAFDTTTGKLIKDSGIAISDIPSGGIAKFDYGFSADSQPYLKTSSGVYEVLCRFVFRGTTAVGTPTVVQAGANLGGASPAGSLRLFDPSGGGTTIAEDTSITGATPGVHLLTIAGGSPWPTAATVIEVQGKTSGDELQFFSIESH